MQLIKNKEKIGNILFVVAIVIELIIMMTDHMAAFTLPLRGRWAQLAFVLFGCKILTTKYSVKQWLVIVIMAVLGSISYFTMGDEYVLRAAVMVFAAKDIDKQLIYKIIFCGALAGTILIILLAFMGVAGNLTDVRDYGREGIETRWCMGFNHANNVHCILWYIVTMFVLARDNKIRITEYIVIITMDVGLYFLTASKTGLIAVGFIVIASLFARYYKKINQMLSIYIIGTFTVVVCVVLSLIGSRYSCFESKFTATLDKFLNQRLNMCHDHAYLGDWVLFPGPRVHTKAVDNGIASFGYLYGIVMLIIMISLILYLIWKAYIEKNLILMALSVTCTYVWFMESTFIINTSLLCMVIFILLFDRWYIKESI